MPIYRFWTMNAQITRISAEQDMRSARIARMVQGDQDAMKSLDESLRGELDSPINVMDIERIETPLENKDRLKQLSKG
jgi:nitrate/nitrite-specific signal transduction histidine kinase